MHLTHGAKPTFSGKYFNVIQYDVNPDTYLIDYENIEHLLNIHKPRLLIVGASAYSREIDFKKIKLFLDVYNQDKEEENKCYYMVDMAHIAGLVAVELHQSPIPYADVVTTTTHKTLRGPRGGLILTNDAEIAKKINSAVFPGIQGGPLENIIAAKAVCFGEALKPEFKEYMQQVVNNTFTLADELSYRGIKVLTGGTDNHLLLLDLRDTNITGQELQDRLENVGIITNKNAIPFDTENKMVTSGLRLGAAAVTSRGLKEEQMVDIAEMIYLCITDYENNIEFIKQKVKKICKCFPLYKKQNWFLKKFII